MELRLFYRESCPYSQKVIRFMRQNGLEPRIDAIDLDEENEARDELLQISGRSQVPCLVVDGNPMLESEDINRWLHENLVKRRETQSRKAG